jgi:hypothetical protein
MKKKYTLYLLIGLASATLCFTACKKEDNKEEEETTKPGTNPGAAELLSGAVTGTPFTTGIINDFTLASNEGRVILLAANNTTGKVYAIELNDNDAATASVNAWTGDASAFMTNIAGQLGVTLPQTAVMNMEVNPISKSVYVLVMNRQNNRTSLFKATKGGTEIAPVTFTDVKYSAITFSSSGHAVNDMTWGDNKLYLSSNMPSTLNGNICSIAAPFAHDAAMTSRSTSLYKSNWGGGFFTDAPLETMTYAEVDGEKRLLGVTVCSPGFSLKTSEIGQSQDVLQVNETFNLNTNVAVKVFAVTQGDKSYLVELHNTGRLTRVGEQYLNDSQPMNADVKYILSSGGTAVAAGLNDEAVKIVAPQGTYVMVSKYSETKILVMNAQGAVSLLDI